ncbi:MAG: TetR/AcrR family transcriptional regulator [Pseudomonadota bacterium]|nr:TetR/AcrR family transcriptional regulator [Pseudomonadota bacterium]
MTTRRERLRAATIEEIKEAALSQIAEVGGPALSLRGVAREIEMSPAGLYRYYDGRDALLTDLIVDAYNALADAVEVGIESGGESASERFAAGIRAYRRWGVDNPNRFLLIFGTPIPGYAAPEGGPTVAANRRMGEAFFMVGVEAWRAGQLHPQPLGREITQAEMQLSSEIDPNLPAELIPSMLGSWAHFHGLVNLEVLNQWHWLYGTHTEEFFEGEIQAILRAMGMSG